MRRYFTNLFYALKGCDPYREGRDELLRQIEKAGEKDVELRSLQRLVENLRERIRDYEQENNELRGAVVAAHRYYNNKDGEE